MKNLLIFFITIMTFCGFENGGGGGWDYYGFVSKNGALVSQPLSYNVGINSLSPGVQLDVVGTIRATNFSGNITLPAGSNLTPNVGIGSTNPGQALDVQGTVRGFISDIGGAVYNVKSYGAKGDANTDDTTSINKAIISACAAQPNIYSPTTVYFPAGSYKITSSINATCRLTLSGDGYDNTTIMTDSGASPDNLKHIYITHDNVMVQNMQISLFGNGQTGIYIDSSGTMFQNVNVMHVHIVDYQNASETAGNTAIVYSDSWGWMDDVTIEFQSVLSTSGNFYGVHVINNAPSSAWSGVVILKNSYISLVGNTGGNVIAFLSDNVSSPSYGSIFALYNNNIWASNSGNGSGFGVNVDGSGNTGGISGGLFLGHGTSSQYDINASNSATLSVYDGTNLQDNTTNGTITYKGRLPNYLKTTWTSSVDAGNFALTDLNNVGIGTTKATSPLIVVGNVGINTLTASNKLDIFGDTDITGGNLGIGIKSNNSGDPLQLDLGAASNTGYMAVSTTGDRIRMGYSFNGGLIQNYQAAQVVADSTGNLILTSRSSQASGIQFWSTPSSPGTTSVRIMDISSTGNVGIGSLSPGQALDVNGTVRGILGGTCSFLYKCVGGVDAGVIQTVTCGLCPGGTCTQMAGCF